ncbi:MAG: ROK family protein [bacterium]
MKHSSNYIVGVDLGGTNIVSLLVGSEERIVAKDIRATLAREGKEKTLCQIVSSVRAVLEKGELQGISSASIEGVGVGSPGPLNTKKGIIHFAPNLPGWNNVPLVSILEDQLKLPIFLENDANAAALAEWWIGVGKKVDNLVLLTLGTGIGGGIIIGGEVLHGAWDTAAEIGHMIIHEGGLVCGCGKRGCLEAYASATGVIKRTVSLIKEGRKTLLRQLVHGRLENITCELVYRAAEREDELSQEIAQETARYLGIGIASLVNIINPEMVILSGGMTAAGDLLFEPVRKYARKYALEVAIRGVRIVPAKLGENTGALGAAATVLKRRGWI